MDPFQAHYQAIRSLYLDDGIPAAKVQETLELLYGFPKMK